MRKRTLYALLAEKTDLQGQIDKLTALINKASFAESMPYVSKIVRLGFRLDDVKAEADKLREEVKGLDKQWDTENVYTK